MARVVYGGGVTEYIGSIGGTTFQSNGSGFIARNKPVYRKRKSLDQVHVMGIFSSISQVYRASSTGDKALWQTFADANPYTDLWGNVKTIQGINYFVSINIYRWFNGDALLVTPPAFTLPSALPAFTITINPSTLVIDTASPWGTASETIMLFATRATNSKTLNLNRNLLFIDAFKGNAATTRDVTAGWEDVTKQNVNTALFVPDNWSRLVAYKFLDSTGLTIPYVIGT